MKKVLFQLKKQRSIPENAICRNCSTQIQGRYCHECGQDYFAGMGTPVIKLIGQMLDNTFALEGKTPRTLLNLMFRPGFLSVEYMNGKVSRYVHPVKLFWMATLIFFPLLITQCNKSGWQKDVIESINANDENLNFSTHTKTVKLNSENVKENEANKEIEKQKLVELISMASQIVPKFAPYAAFLLIPFFALLLLLFFWRKNHYYIHHLIFTTHFHAFLWVFLGLKTIVNIFVRSEYPTWLSILLFFIPGIYFVFALHRFYQLNSWWSPIWKSVAISILYFFVISFFIIILAFFVIKIYFPELYS
jgi:hypothetical protein